MTAIAIAAGVVQVLGVVLAPLVVGFVGQLKAYLQGRRGPGPLQPYRELRRIWRKQSILPGRSGPIYRAAPAVVTAGVLAAMLVVPIAGQTFSAVIGNDAFVLVGLLALTRFGIALAAWDTGTGFALMAAGRDLMVSVFAEAVLLLVILLSAIAAHGSTDLTVMSNAATGTSIWSDPAHWCAAIGFALVAIAETGRQPIDNPDTHLELTMIHEGPLLEYGGRDLAFLQWAASARLWLMATLAAALFMPAGGSFVSRLSGLILCVALLCAMVAVTEVVMAKMRILRIPVLLGAGAVICLIGYASQLIGAGA